jgi:hypothetical protein
MHAGVPQAFTPPVTWGEDFQNFLTPYSHAWVAAVISLCCWLVIHAIASKLFCSKYDVAYGQTAKKSDEKKGKKVKTDEYYRSHANWEMSIKTTALLHAIISSTGATFAILTADQWALSVENLYNPDPLQRFILGISCGYFLYDLIIAIVGQDIPFLIHGSMSSLIYLQAYGQNFCLQLGCFFLMYEFSTIFLNIRALMIATGNGSHPQFPIVEKLFFGSFMFFRMVIGLVYSALIALPTLTKLAYSGTAHSAIAASMLVVANCAINGLNVMWSSAMVAILKGRGKRDVKDDKKVEKKAD